jgi:hypothetical protein
VHNYLLWGSALPIYGIYWDSQQYPDNTTVEFAFCRMYTDMKYQEIPSGATQDGNVGFVLVKLMHTNNGYMLNQYICSINLMSCLFCKPKIFTVRWL